MEPKKFNLLEIMNENQIIEEEFLKELHESNSIRTGCLILTNYAENIIRNIISIEFQSLKIRKISRETIVDILYEKEILNKEAFDDFKRIFQIRDFYGHNMRLTEIDKEIAPIIDAMHQTKKTRKESPNWDDLTSHEKVKRISIPIMGFLKTILIQTAEGRTVTTVNSLDNKNPDELH